MESTPAQHRGVCVTLGARTLLCARLLTPLATLIYPRGSAVLPQTWVIKPDDVIGQTGQIRKQTHKSSLRFPYLAAGN